MAKRIQRQKAEVFPSGTAENAPQPPSGKDEQDPVAKELKGKPSAHLSVLKATGPRTPEGKEISKRNALKHGIFSEVTVLPGESSQEYQSLLTRLQEALQPEGRLEELLVEKLAVFSWRLRRLLQAEGAEIRQGSEFVEYDRAIQLSQEAEEAGTRKPYDDSLGIRRGLIWKIRNPEILDRCLEGLCELRQRMESSGFHQEEDVAILRGIYGTDTHLRETLYQIYLKCFETSEGPEEERQRQGCSTPEECREIALSEIDAETRRLRRYRRDQAPIESDRTELEVLRRKVPDSPSLDRLLRYEATLERGFDRTLNQLERIQRLRRGQPVAPRIEVNVSRDP